MTLSTITLAQVSIVAGILCTALTLLATLIGHRATRLARDNHRLRWRLKLAVDDLEAFAQVEQTWCQLAVGRGFYLTPEKAKRAVRYFVRQGGGTTPSDYSSPSKLAAERQRYRLVEDVGE